MKRMAIVAALVAALLLVVVGSAYAQSGQYLCNIVVSDGRVQLDCVPFVPTATPLPPTETPTPVPPTGTPVAPTATPDMIDMMWHPPGAHGDRPFHEHGAQPPQWVLDAGYMPMFAHAHGTVGENLPYYKHTAFKAYSARYVSTEGYAQDIYAILHQDFSPAGRASRFHSYQLWVRDPSGAVSHFSGWNDFGVGDSAGPQLVEVCGTGSSVRPVIMVNKLGCADVDEVWYGATYGLVDWGQNMPSNYYAGGDPTNPATWLPVADYARNGRRRIEIGLYVSRFPVRGAFWTDQFGRRVTGPSDPACSSSITVGGKSYPIECAQQVAQPTLRDIKFPGNAWEVQYDMRGVVLPN